MARLNPQEASLAALLAPISEATFFEDYFERRPLYLKASSPDRFAALRSSIDIDDLVDHDCCNWGEVSLARADSSADDCPHLDGPPSAVRVNKAFADGYTVVINDLQDRVDAVGWLCRRLESHFFCRANTNLYWSPAGRAGLAPHYDDDDVIVFQIEGSKLWKVYPHCGHLPTGRTPYRLGALGQTKDILLSPGDMLYLPRGTPHEALAVDSASMHLTVSLNLVRWSEVIAELVGDLLEQDPQCRRAVPPALLRAADADFLTLARDRLSGALKGGLPSLEIAARVQRRLAGNAHRLPSVALGLEGDRYRTAPDQLCGMTRTHHDLLLEAIGVSCRLHPRWDQLCRWLVDGEPFSAWELADMGTTDEIADILGGLLESGVIVRCNAPVADSTDNLSPSRIREGIAHA